MKIMTEVPSPLFIRHRIQLLNSKKVSNLDILWKGSQILTVEENTEIFDAVCWTRKGDLNN
jgi:hypothetical protein